jgi:hypothetical protein
MVHVSTAYVNINHPADSTIHECIYPLMNGEVEVDGEATAQVWRTPFWGRFACASAPRRLL